MEPYTIRAALPAELSAIMPLYDQSRQFMRDCGNHKQWIGGYPSRQLIEDDIRRGRCHVVCNGDEIAGVFAFVTGRDATYEHIEAGAWQEDTRPYATLHRIARRSDRHGIFKACIDWSRSHHTSLRIDTHEANHVMQHLIGREGFRYCGIIHIADGSPRHAYQMLDTRTLCEPLAAHIRQHILPRYDAFDSAHRRDHALTVIQNSLDLAKHYDVEINMVYTIAAYHDIGLIAGRDRHHLVSAQMLLADKELTTWFSGSQLHTMADAIEDHRASSAHEPRSLYGRIVAEADRDIRPLTIIRRTIQYGLSHCPTLDQESHWQRTQAHLQEKYGEHGYLKLWLPESPNAQALHALRQLIADPDALRTLFLQIYDEELHKTNN